jgi:hypothetical protein
MVWLGVVLLNQEERNEMTKAAALSEATNDGKQAIESVIPYIAYITIEGTAPILFHRWSVDGVEAKAKAAKNSAAKKSDDLETYIYRNDKGQLCLPAEYLRGAVIGASKFKQDPRSPRKSAQDLCKAAIISMEELCVLTDAADKAYKVWDYEDRRRACIQRNGITRVRPALHAGWRVTVPLMVNLPEYISPQLLNELVQMAGKLIGIADFRPTFGRFNVVKFEV